ncbi:MAG TPA: hypothetical protein V6C65_34695 [Allocoleopsis sp.]
MTHMLGSVLNPLILPNPPTLREGFAYKKEGAELFKVQGDLGGSQMLQHVTKQF